jgi:hypothetical protein
MDRRQFLAAAGIGAGIGAATLAAPLRVAAQAAPDAATRSILDLAREQVARHDAVLWRRDVAAIADFGLHSATPRFHIANLEAGTVRSLLVSHGSGSDPDHDGWLNDFSNLHDSWATSSGAYVSWEWYEGIYGTSMRLGGLEPTNDQAFPRAIVVHAADYATAGHAERWGRLGRSNGCFAVAPDELPAVLYQLAGGRLLFAGRLSVDPAMPAQSPVDFEAAIAQRRAQAAQEDAELGPEAAPSFDELP